MAQKAGSFKTASLHCWVILYCICILALTLCTLYKVSWRINLNL